MGFFRKSEREKEEERYIKEYNKEMDALEKEINKKDKISIKELFKKDPYEEDLLQYMTPKQLEEEKKEKRRTKVFTISAIVLVIGAVVAFGVVSGIILYANRSELEKIHKKEILDYYKKEFGYDIKVESIDYMCGNKYKADDDDCKNKIKLITANNEIIYKWNGVFADNIYTSSIYEDYNNYVRELSPGMGLFWNSPILSDIDYDDPYNMFSETSNIFQSKVDFNSLVETNKLVVNDIFMYKDNLNVEGIQEFVDKLNENSNLLFIKSSNADVFSVYFFKKGYHIEVPVIGTVNISNEIKVHRFDPNIAINPELNIEKVKNIDAITKINDKYELQSAYIVNYKDKVRRRSDDGTEPTFDYYLIEYNGTINRNNLFQFAGETESTIERYLNYLIASYAGKTYIFANIPITFGTKTEIKKGIFN